LKTGGRVFCRVPENETPIWNGFFFSVLSLAQAPNHILGKYSYGQQLHQYQQNEEARSSHLRSDPAPISYVSF
jgi:hypothetical protein